METTGNIFDIQHFSVGDGPGIRTTVFLKGCPLRCQWCHNPESLSSQPQIMLKRQSCVGCGACVEACLKECHSIESGVHAFDGARCTFCGICVRECYYGGVTVVGRNISAFEVIEEVAQDMAFFKSSGGGMTLSGGEPMYQPEFAVALAKEAKGRGISVCLETSGFCAFKALERIFPFIDLFLYDYKATGESHKELCGADNALILENLRRIDEMGGKIVLRCPMVPGKNICEEHILGIIQTARGLTNILEVDLEPYHNIGIGKRYDLGSSDVAEKIMPPGHEEMQRIAERIERESGVRTVVM